MTHSADRTFWQDRSVFVTGGSGFLGGCLVRELLDAGASVVCLLRDWVPESAFVRDGLLSRVSVVRGDISDERLLERALGEFETQTVIHLAAQTIVGIANANPWSTLESNVRGTYALLEACRRSPRICEVVVASSDKAYGAQPQLPYREDMPLAANHPYDVSKACGDLLAQMFANTFKLPVAITRCGNFYGGGDLNWNRIVPGTIRSLLRGDAPVIRSDGRMLRDYIYTEDAVAAYLGLVQALAAGTARPGEAFNFSTESPVTVLEIVERLQRLMERPDLAPIVLNEAPYEIPAQHLSAAKARERLGWTPRFALDEGLTRTIAWYRSFLPSASSPA